MMTAEIKINGITIAHVYAVNKGSVTPDPDVAGLCEYHYEYYIPEGGVTEGKVEQYRPNGAAALLRLIFNDISRKGGK